MSKRMKISFYLPQEPSHAPKYVGGQSLHDYYYRSASQEAKLQRKKAYKKQHKYMIQRPLLETLKGIIEASKCKTLDTFQTEWKEELYNAIEHEGGEKP